MPTFDYVQVGNGPIGLTCRGCGYRATVRRATAVQRAVDQHKCRENTKRSAR